ncbi:MAG: hypothetical protein ACOC5S_06150, partial [Acidobacteriota bacterium]
FLTPFFYFKPTASTGQSQKNGTVIAKKRYRLTYLPVFLRPNHLDYGAKRTLMGSVNFTFILFWLVFCYLSELLYRGFISVTIFL